MLSEAMLYLHFRLKAYAERIQMQSIGTKHHLLWLEMAASWSSQVGVDDNVKYEENKKKLTLVFSRACTDLAMEKTYQYQDWNEYHYNVPTSDHLLFLRHRVLADEESPSSR